MESIERFPKAAKIAINLLSKESMSMQSFSARFDPRSDVESGIFGYQCLLTMKEDGLVEEVDGLFELTDKAEGLREAGNL